MTHEDGKGTGEHLNSVLQGELSRRDLLKGAVGAGAFFALSPLLSACGSGSTTTGSIASPTGAPTKGGHLRVGMIDFSAKDTLDPHLAGTAESNEAMNINCFEGLMALSPTMEVVNALAEELTANNDATEYTARLRSGVTFHNGKPVTADDVIFSFKRMMNPKDPKTAASLFSDVKRIQKMDQQTVRFTLGSPNAVFPEMLANYAAPILPDGFEVGGVKALVGTGPFKVDAWSQGQQADFSPFADYYGQVPYVEKMTWYRQPDATAQLNALLGGSIDWATGVQPSQVKLVQSSPGYQTFQSKSGQYSPFLMRVDQKPFDDARVRQAFRLIIDRKQMIDSSLLGFAAVGNDMQAPMDPGYPKSVAQRQPDIEQAKSLLKQAGYDNNLTIQLDTSLGTGSYMVNASTVFAEQAKAAGVTVKVNNIDTSQYYGDAWLSYLFSTDIWATRGYLANAMLQSMPTAPWNQTHWKNAEWLAIVQEALRTPDDAKRNELIGQALTIEHDQGGYIIWSFPDLIDAHSDKVAGAVADVFMVSAIGWRFNSLYFA